MTNMTRGPDRFAVCKKYGNIVKYGSITIILIIAVANVIIGARYQDYCRFAVPKYLMATGGGTLTFIGLVTIAECICYSRTMMFASFCVRFLVQSGTLIWGTIEVFGWFSSWVYDPNMIRNPGYCDYTLYMYSFVMLVIGWCTIALLLLPLPCACIFYCMSRTSTLCPGSRHCDSIASCCCISFFVSTDPVFYA